MAQDHSQISEPLQKFIAAQPVFFVGSAPLSGDGHVNVSPKGLDCLRILSPTKVAYLDLTGSGNETAAHAMENGRITFMFCAFTGKPLILRLYGRAHVVRPEESSWQELAALFPTYAGARQIIVADIHLVKTSCGYGVPIMQLVGNREQLLDWAMTKGDDGLETFRTKHNTRSLDGLPTPERK
jgi:hypothetical protein